MTKMKLALVLAGCLISGVAAAAPAKYDVNRDGALDAQEKATLRADRQAKRAEMKQKLLVKFDANKDGKLDRAERIAVKEHRVLARFSKLDADANGYITLSELKQAHAAKPGKRGKQARVRPFHKRTGLAK